MRVLLRSTMEAAEPGNENQRLHSQSVVHLTDPISFHRRLPGYEERPLVDLPELARTLGVASMQVKDETSRFGLPSFKVLGASWATYVALAELLGPLAGDGEVSFDELHRWAAPLRSVTLMAATDGNHGRAVARVARWFGLEAQIFVPNFVSSERRRLIESEGAKLTVVDGVYDASVDAAIQAAREDRAILISDTARSRQDAVPQHVIAGYSTAFTEVEAQLARSNPRIDVVSVQAGVGGLASACTNWARQVRRGAAPRVVVTEPTGAPCVLAALAADEPVAVAADIISNMCVLQCGTISLTAFATLQAGVSCSVAIEDHWAERAVAALRAAGVHTTPSGAASTAGLMALLGSPFSASVRQHLALSPDSRLLAIATEAAENDRQEG